MKMGITRRLFFVILCGTGLSILSLILITWWITENKIQNDFMVLDQELHERLAYNLGKKYEESGNWDFLKCFIIVPNMLSSAIPPQFQPRVEPPSWFNRIMNKIGIGGQLPPRKDDRLFRSPLIVLDADRRVIFGLRPPGEDAFYKPVIVRNRVVGYVGREPPTQFLIPVQREVIYRQKSGLILSLFVTVFVVILISFPLARRFVKPIMQMALATHDIASGRYATRVPVSSSDEIGQLARDFNTMAKALEKNEQGRRQLFADISHELRTPVAVFRTEIEAHMDGILTITPETVRSLHAKTLRLQNLIDDIYQVSLSDLGALTYRKECLDALDALRESVESYRSEFDRKRIRLSLNTEGDATARVLADPTRLNELFLNLLDNSLKYTDAEGELRVVAQVDGDVLTIEFQDSKPGVSYLDRCKLFERFYRVESSRKRDSGGTGLGLTISKKIVDAHEGTISAHESPLGGLLIRIVLPVYRGSQ